MRDVISKLTDDTSASAKADGITVNTSAGLQENPANGGRLNGSEPTSFSRSPMICAKANATAIPISGAGTRCDQRAHSQAVKITETPRSAGIQRAWVRFESTPAKVPSVELDALVHGDAIPKITSICEISIIAPIPHENPDTTSARTRCAYLPR